MASSASPTAEMAPSSSPAEEMAPSSSPAEGMAPSLSSVAIELSQPTTSGSVADGSSSTSGECEQSK